MPNEDECLSICLLAISISSLMKCLQTCCLFFNWVVCFLTIKFKEFGYTLDINILSDKCFANIFSQSASCIFILLVYYAEKF